MARPKKNKISFEREWDDEGRAIYRFTGSQRQPTMNEIEEWIENNNPSEIEEYFMVYALKCKDIGGYQGFDEYEPEENKTIEFWGYYGGKNGGSCPICGKERDLSGERCPVCDRPWE